MNGGNRGCGTPDDDAPRMGKNSIYTATMADRIIELMRSGLSLSEICRRDGFPLYGTVHDWIMRDDDFRKRWETAQKIRASMTFDAMEMLERDVLEEVIKAGPAKVAIMSMQWRLQRMDRDRFSEKSLLKQALDEVLMMYKVRGASPEAWDGPDSGAEGEKKD